MRNVFSPTRRPLAAALSALLIGALAVPAVVSAQDIGSGSMRSQRDKRMKELGKGKEEAKQAEVREAQYPNATRQAPEAVAKGKSLKALQALQELYEKQDMANVLVKAEALAASDAGAYEKAFAYQLAASAAADLDDNAKAADYFGKAVAANGLDNDSHYQAMYNQAVMLYGLEKYTEALATIDRFLAETRSDKPEHAGFRAGILIGLGRNDEAAKAYEALLAKNPDDMKLRMNAVAALQSADKFDQANALLADALKKGQLNDPRQYRALYVGYMNADKDKEALAVIDEGVAKGVLKPGPELGKDLSVLAQKAFYNEKDADAVVLYKRAAPMTADGEAYLNLAMILREQGKTAEAKAAAQSALDKGVKKPENARSILGK